MKTASLKYQNTSNASVERSAATGSESVSRSIANNRTSVAGQRAIQRVMNSASGVAQFTRPNPPKSEGLLEGKQYAIGGHKLTIKAGRGVGGDTSGLLDHMAGDPPGAWNGSPKGGHLSTEMSTRRKYISGDEAQPEFTKAASSNSPHNRPVAKWRWTKVGGGNATNEKISTMWPDSWSKSTLRPVLENAYKTTTDDMFVSAEGTGVQKYFSFTMLSEGGSGTAYPK